MGDGRQQTGTGLPPQPTGYFSDARADVLPLIPRGIHSVLDVGCGEGAFLSSLLSAHPGLRGCGIEADKSAAATAVASGLDVRHGLFPEATADLGGFDCVVFNDVLEHMADPWEALTRTTSLLEPGGWVVASLPNIRNIETLTEIAIGGQFRYRPSGVLDRTHLRFFTMSSGREMFETCGYHVERVQGTILVKSRRQQAVNRALGMIVPGMRREGGFRQFAIVARLR